MSETCQILGVEEKWLRRRMNNGFRFEVRPFNPEVKKSGIHYISRASLRNFIRRYPEELTGRNVDWPMIVDILAGIKTEILSTREEDAEKKVKAENEVVQAGGGTIRLGSSRYTEPPA